VREAWKEKDHFEISTFVQNSPVRMQQFSRELCEAPPNDDGDSFFQQERAPRYNKRQKRDIKRARARLKGEGGEKTKDAGGTNRKRKMRRA